MLNEIISTYKKEKWVICCIRNKINPWKIIDITNDVVVKCGAQVKTRVCMKCGKDFELRYKKGTFTVHKTCSCGADGTSTQTLAKMECYWASEDAMEVLTQSNLKRRKGLANTIDYWVHLGYTPNEAMIEVKKVQQKRNAIATKKMTGTSIYSCRSILFWMNKGLTEFESTKKVAEIQTTNGIAYYINKYGADTGKILFDERISKWLTTYYTRADIAAINKRKSFSKLDKIAKFGLADYLSRENIRMQKRYSTMVSNGIWCAKDRLVEKQRYYEKVSYFTRKSLAYYFDIINPTRVDIGYRKNHIDHIMSIHHGFMYGVAPEIIGSYLNLRVLCWRENISKGIRSDQTIEELTNLYENIDENWTLIVCNAGI